MTVGTSPAVISFRRALVNMKIKPNWVGISIWVTIASIYVMFALVITETI